MDVMFFLQLEISCPNDYSKSYITTLDFSHLVPSRTSFSSSFWAEFKPIKDCEALTRAPPRSVGLSEILSTVPVDHESVDGDRKVTLLINLSLRNVDRGGLLKHKSVYSTIVLDKTMVLTSDLLHRFRTQPEISLFEWLETIDPVVTLPILGSRSEGLIITLKHDSSSSAFLSVEHFRLDYLKRNCLFFLLQLKPL